MILAIAACEKVINLQVVFNIGGYGAIVISKMRSGDGVQHEWGTC